MKRKLRLKPSALRVLKIIGIIIFILVSLLVFYFVQVNDLKKIGYSRKAANQILIKFKKKDVIDIGKNKTLNKAFESDAYKEKNFDSYTKIKYQNHAHLIENINKLLKKGYTNEEVSVILAHGSDSDVSEFAKRDKVRYLDEFYTIDFAKIKYYYFFTI